ncbi:hypothetical protein CW751_11575 [Brumimicrobium salinarum]|uniref:Uncharacterized protein n=1 Tax=Brumimicrobium salinarum TaxID=2058658 RepID=A0A2I0R0M3_9FLAO|nr:hypothetical protein [Brumimicrobium salinarum]PKR80136.1 hypothetical protein CW751_11575 [Brumimicrobium salinarum]
MKNTVFFILFFSIFINLHAQVNPTLVNIPHEVFVNDGRTDFNKLFVKNDTLKEQVKLLHTQNELSHDFSVQVSNFEQYWNHFKADWNYVRFKKNATPLLLFSGYKNANDEREYVEVYNAKQDRNQRLLFSEVGNLLAYKINPHTQESILYVHKYPCCRSASHNIYKLRQTEQGVHITDRFFVGRDRGDMQGDFFPEKTQFNKEYKILKKKTALRWSPEVIEKDAFVGWTESNLMIHYNKGAIYKVLAEKDDWYFVLFLSGIVEEQSMMLNYTNFKHKGVYGWIKK